MYGCCIAIHGCTVSRSCKSDTDSDDDGVFFLLGFKKWVVYSANVLASLFQKRSYHPGYTASRPISEVKQDRAFSSTQVGDHCETKGGVSFCCRSPFCCTTVLSLSYCHLTHRECPGKARWWLQLFFPRTIFFSYRPWRFFCTISTGKCTPPADPTACKKCRSALVVGVHAHRQASR